MNDVINSLQNALPAIQSAIPPTISGVFGAVVSTLFLRKNVSSEEIERIKSAKFSEVADSLLNDGYITYYDFYKLNNFAKIAKLADKHYVKNNTNTNYKPENETKDKPIDIDWFVRFFEDCSSISDEQFQELWAKILAGEVAQPGSYSLRTLDTLKNMSREDAEYLESIAPYVLYSCNGNDAFMYYFTQNPSSTENHFLIYIVDNESRLFLNEIGVIKSTDILSKNLYLWNDKYKKVFHNKVFTLYGKKDRYKKTKFHVK